MSDWLHILIVGAVAALFGSIPLWLWWRKRKERMDLADFLATEPLVVAPPVPSGPVQLQGGCLCEQPLAAPLSGQDCVGYCLEVSVHVDDTDGGHHWDLAVVQELAPCSLDLGGAQVAVESKRASLWLDSASSARKDQPLNELPSKLVNKVRTQARKRYGHARTDIVPKPGQDVRIAERLLLPEETVFVVGQVFQTSPSSDAAPENRIGPRPGQTLLMFGGSREQALSALKAGSSDQPNPWTIM